MQAAELFKSKHIGSSMFLLFLRQPVFAWLYRGHNCVYVCVKLWKEVRVGKTRVTVVGLFITAAMLVLK